MWDHVARLPSPSHAERHVILLPLPDDRWNFKRMKNPVERGTA